MVPEVSLRCLGRPPGAPLGPSWPPTWPSWRPLGDSLAAFWPLLGSLLAALVAPKSRNFPHWISFWMNSACLGLRLHSKSCEIVPRACEIMTKTCLQRRASRVELPRGCGGRAKRTQSAALVVYDESEAFEITLRTLRTLCRTLGGLPPPPSTGLRASAPPPACEDFFCGPQNPF